VCPVRRGGGGGGGDEDDDDDDDDDDGDDGRWTGGVGGKDRFLVSAGGKDACIFVVSTRQPLRPAKSSFLKDYIFE
jgi:hypothetical protein